MDTATGLALLALAGAEDGRRRNWPSPARRPSTSYAGVRCGIMDQTVVGRAKAGHALLLDCQSLSVTHVPIALKGYSFAVFDTGVRHKLAGSEYNKRRAECEHAAALMKKKSLRGVSLEDLLKHARQADGQ